MRPKAPKSKDVVFRLPLYRQSPGYERHPLPKSVFKLRSLLRNIVFNLIFNVIGLMAVRLYVPVVSKSDILKPGTACIPINTHKSGEEKVVHCSTAKLKSTLLPLDLKANHQTESPLQYPYADFPREAEKCGSPRIWNTPSGPAL